MKTSGVPEKAGRWETGPEGTKVAALAAGQSCLAAHLSASLSAACLGAEELKQGHRLDIGSFETWVLNSWIVADNR